VLTGVSAPGSRTGITESEDKAGDNEPAEITPRKRSGFTNFENFTTMRLFAAAVVLFSHGFAIAEGFEDREPLQATTGEIAGIYAVYVFFVMSGFLITRSWTTSSSTVSYVWKRFLRIYPAYAASILVCSLLIAPWWFQGPLLEYYKQPEVYRAIAHGLIFNIEGYSAPGVRFYDESDFGWVLNGVLWTLKIEVFLYAAVAVLGVLRLLRLEVVLALSLIGLASTLTKTYLDFELLGIWQVNWGLSFGVPGFFSGSFLFFVFQKREPSRALAIILGIAAVVVPFLDLSAVLPAGAFSHELFPVLAAYPVIWLGHASAPDLGHWSRYGDLSYGLYAFGWPIQQVVRSWVGDGMSGWMFFPLCLLPALAVAWLSWHLVESKALQHKTAL